MSFVASFIQIGLLGGVRPYFISVWADIIFRIGREVSAFDEGTDPRLITWV